jgi:crotonobetainyl-CoA:carnitine CoA-transferase CaiB-like acyl-CoA transferase|tara:strand:- start:12848 stop:15232 length:2385 start_codon:yes stop_codon:yes gene_type:complete
MTESLKVLEIGGGVSAAYAARLLGDHGADVVKVEPPAGDPTRARGPFPNNEADEERSGLFLALNLNKRSVCLDLAVAAAREKLQALIDWADIVVHSLRRAEAMQLGLDRDSISADRPELVVLSMTPFGMTGPYSEFAAEELIVAHAGGWPSMCPMTHQEPEYPPLKVHGHHCSLMAGIAGAMSALAVHLDARRSGVGELIDFSVQEYVASVLEFGIHIYTYHDFVISRLNQRSTIPWRIFNAKDGPIFVVCIEEDQWERLVEFMGQPEWTQMETFVEPSGRAENQDMVNVFLEEFISEWNVFDLYHAAQKFRICFAPVMSFAQIGASEHLRARNFFTTVDIPSIGPIEFMAPPVIASEGRATIRLAAPQLGEHTDEVLEDIQPAGKVNATVEAKLPLSGLRVVDLTWAWAGPFCSMNLAHLGADVIHIESESRPDLYRRGGGAPEGIEPSLNTNGMFNQWNQGKRSVAIDLRTDRGIELVKELVAHADVLVQNFATGVMARLGLGYDVLKEINPSLIMASISGYGQSGPYREYMGYGPSTGPLSGLSSATGYAGGGPEETGVAMPDPTAGITAAWSVVSALARREETGAGEHLDVTLWESTTALTVEGWMEHSFNGTQAERIGNRDPCMSPHGCFPCEGEDQWVTLACADDAAWQTLCTVVPGLSEDARFASLDGRKEHEDELEAVISAWTQSRDRWEITRQLQALGIAAFPSFTCADVVEDPHLNERGFIEHLDHPEVGTRAHTGIPWRLAKRPNGVRMPAPCLGGHTHDVLAEVLGYSDEEIAKLHEQGVLS